MLSGTHTHSGPGGKLHRIVPTQTEKQTHYSLLNLLLFVGYSEYSMYDITTMGFHKDNWKTIIDGIVQAISRAHDSLKPGKILINQGELLESNIKYVLQAVTQNEVHFCSR